MNPVPLARLTSYLDRTLRVAGFTDYDDAFNGLQCENRSGRVTRIAAAVDANEFTINAAIRARADLLLVHHGLFWSRPQPWTGRHWRKIRALVDGNLAVYSCHLPLDAHPKCGNNILIAKGLGLRRVRPFLVHHGKLIGWRGELPVAMTADALSVKVAALLAIKSSQIKTLPFGPKRLRSIGVCSGGAGGELKAAAAAGVDAYITGEGAHWTFGDAEELGVAVIYGGHYATETFGVRAVGEHLSKKFHVPSTFIDHPSGM
jgi:dinuclear metal center YbgI/SA1388 family protein